jgi:glutamine synthetase
MGTLEALAADIEKEFQLTPVVAVEIEWYFRRRNEAAPLSRQVALESILTTIAKKSNAAGIALHSIEHERGPGQVEAALHMSKNIGQLAVDIMRLKNIVDESCAEHGLIADFTAKPYAEEYGSGIHVHLHLEDAQGINVFWKEDARLSPSLRFAIQGLLTTMQDNMAIFAPYRASYARFVANQHAPVNISWGFNNRTTAIRLPDPGGQVQGAEAIAQMKRIRQRRIEHRVAGSDANVYEVLSAVLYGVYKGLKEKILPPEPIYGDAADAQYGLESISLPSY